MRSMLGGHMMFCKECGNKIRKGNKFCTSCGRRIEIESVKSKVIFFHKKNISNRIKKSKSLIKDILKKCSQKYNITKRKIAKYKVKIQTSKKCRIESNKKPLSLRSKRLKMIICILLILILIVGFYTAYSLLNKPVLVPKVTLNGRYFSLYDNKGYIEFNEEKLKNYDGIYKRVIESKSIYCIEDKYRVEGNMLILLDSLLRKESKYLIYKDYLIPTNLCFEGVIPNEETFNVNCSRDNIEYIFKDDGTFIKKEDSIDTGIRSVSGTYERNGELIILKIDGEDEEFKLLIYKNKINDCAYKKELK